jgi:hypothetical protein
VAFFFFFLAFYFGCFLLFFHSYLPFIYIVFYIGFFLDFFWLFVLFYIDFLCVLFFDLSRKPHFLIKKLVLRHFYIKIA